MNGISGAIDGVFLDFESAIKHIRVLDHSRMRYRPVNDGNYWSHALHLTQAWPEQLPWG
jgi:hypothetical protein